MGPETTSCLANCHDEPTNFLAGCLWLKFTDMSRPKLELVCVETIVFVLVVQQRGEVVVSFFPVQMTHSTFSLLMSISAPVKSYEVGYINRACFFNDQPLLTLSSVSLN